MTVYLQTGSDDPAYNLAFEEYVLKNDCQGDILILWQNRNAVIVGRNQNALEEINRDFVEQHGIQVVRRNTGGGAVYHDLGNLNYSFITDYCDGDTAANSRFTAPVIRSLRALGLDAESTGRNDILVNGRKVSGTAQQRVGSRILHHGTLLFDSDAEMIAGSLNPDPTKFQSKSIKSVRSRVGNIRSELDHDMTMEQFWAHLLATLSQDGIVPTSLPESALEGIVRLKQEKYDTWQWNYGSSPKFDTRIRRRFPGGGLDIYLCVRHGRIESIRIFGDFLALQPIDALTQALTGVDYRRSALEAALQPVLISDYLGGITSGELIGALLNE